MIDVSKYEGHTPGAWNLMQDEDDGYQESSIVTENGITICTTDRDFEYCDIDLKLIADATLILEELIKAQARIKELEGK